MSELSSKIGGLNTFKCCSYKMKWWPIGFKVKWFLLGFNVNRFPIEFNVNWWPIRLAQKWERPLWKSWSFLIETAINWGKKTPWFTQISMRQASAVLRVQAGVGRNRICQKPPDCISLIVVYILTNVLDSRLSPVKPRPSLVSKSHCFRLYQLQDSNFWWFSA